MNRSRRPSGQGWAGICLLGLCLSACSEPQGRIMEESEQDYVGARAAGAATFDRLVTGCVEKLLQSVPASNAGAGKLQVATVPVENASSEELVDWQEQIYELIATSINQSERFKTVNRRFVEQALRETRLRVEQLFIPARRREFLAVLETQNNPAKFLIFPKLTSGSTAGDGVNQRNYLLVLDMVDVETGEEYKATEQLRKAYTP